MVCGVCYQPHQVDAATWTHVCPIQNRSYEIAAGTVRSLQSRGKERYGYREFSLRAIVGGNQRLYRWSGSYDQQVEAKSGDQFVLSFTEQGVTAFYNTTLNLHWTFPSPTETGSRDLPFWVTALFAALVVAICVAAVLAVSARTVGWPRWFQERNPVTDAPPAEQDHAPEGHPGGPARAGHQDPGEGQSLCGSPGAQEVAATSAGDWTRYACRPRGRLSSADWSKCLVSKDYSPVRGRGCKGAVRCCPPELPRP